MQIRSRFAFFTALAAFVAAPILVFAQGWPAVNSDIDAGIATIGAAKSDLSNAVLPDAVRNLGLTYVVKSGQSIQTALTAAAVTGGGTVFVQVGTYNTTDTLYISSNTRLLCERGATINALGASFMPGTKATIKNINNAAGAITDQNITIENCTFTADATFAADGTYRAILMRMARNIRVVGNRFTAGGNATAMLASDGTFVDGNYMTGALNVCWDHWEAPQDAVVTAANYCESSLYGAMFTGTDTQSTTATKGVRARLAGIYKMSGTAGAGIWINGIGTVGSGVTEVVIDKPIITFANSVAGQTCIKVSGDTKQIQVDGPICQRGIIIAGDDSGGAASNVVLSGPMIDEPTTNAGVSPITIQNVSNNIIIRDARIRKGSGSYAHAITIGAMVTNTTLGDLRNVEAGSSGVVSNAAGTSTKFDNRFELITQTGNYTVTPADSGKHITNRGATGQADRLLPPAAVGLNYCFYSEVAGQTVKIIAAAGDKIGLRSADTSAAGSIQSNERFASVCLEATVTSSPGRWVVPSEVGRWASDLAPFLLTCGTSPAISGTDAAGEVTMGTGNPTGCTIAFGTAYAVAPYCNVTWQGTPLASQSYTISPTAITLIQTATSSNKVNYACTGRAQ